MRRKQPWVGWTVVAVLVLLCLPGCVREAESSDWEELLTKEIRFLSVALDGEKPTAMDFLLEKGQELCREGSVSVSFSEEPDYSLTSEGRVELVFSQSGKTILTSKASFSLVKDTEAPKLDGVCDFSIYCGEGVALRSGLTLSDNCFGSIRLDIDDSLLDTEREGTYLVTYRVSDASGNEAVEASRVTVYPRVITEEMLWERVDTLLTRLFPQTADREQKCRAIYDCVQASMSYEPRQSQSDWVSAAYLALFVEGKGDCYSYLCATRALLFRSGVDYMIVQRLPGYTEDTHFWLLVRLDNGEWYHLDPTELADIGFNYCGCLLTDAQIVAYNRVRPHFYEYDTSAFPASGTVILTPIPALDGT